jgi:hypothetical protein
MNRSPFFRIGVLAFLAGALPVQATVTYVGDDLTTNAKWRTSSATKPNDIDGDNVYGSAGYYLAAGLRKGYKDPFLTGNVITGPSNPDQISTMPAWFVSFEFAEPTQAGRSWGGDGGNFGNLDNVGGGHSGFTGAPILQSGALFNSTTMELIFKRTASPAFRLTLIFGNSTEAASWTYGQTTSVDDGSGPVFGSYGDPDFGGAVGYTTYQSFDITAGSSDIVLVIDAVVGLPRLAGLAVDTTSVVAPLITGQPAGGTFLAGATLSLSGSAGGTAPQYQWYKDGAPIAGATSLIYTIASLAAADAGSYHFVAQNSAGSATSSAAAVTVADSLPDNLQAYQAAVKAESSLLAYYEFDLQRAVDSKGSHNGTLAGGAAYAAGVAGGASKALSINAGRVDLGSVAGFQFADQTGTVELWVRPGWYPPTPNSAALCLFANGGAEGVNYAIHLNSPRTVFQFRNGIEQVDIPVPDTGMDWHHLAAIFNAGELTVVWDGEILGTGFFSLGGVTATSQIGSPDQGEGNERWIGDLDEVAVYANALPVSAIQAHYVAFKASSPPAIGVQPVGGHYFAGSAMDLTVTAEGVELSYQWFKNDVAIAGATAATYSVASVATTDAGTYFVRVSNNAGSVDSAPAVVSVNATDLAKYQAAVRQEGSLVSYYTFDGGDANDTKSVNHGYPVDEIGFGKGVGGQNDQALVLTGAGHVGLGWVDAFDFADGTGTFEAWIRADWDTAPPYNPTIAADRDGGPTSWSLHLMQSKAQIAHWNGSAVAFANVPNAGIGWHHFVSTFDGSTWSVYWDGELATSATQDFGVAPESPTQLGSASDYGQERWVGALDEVAFYSEALGADAVRAHYQALVGVPTEPPVISLARAGSQITLSWPAEATGFLLESTDALPGTTWSAVAGVANNRVTVDGSTGTRFYRLRQP